MKILFFEPYALANPHYETALEIMQGHIDKGDEIIFYHCDAQLRSCEANKEHNINTCISCIARRKDGLTLLSNRKAVIAKNFLQLSKSEIHELQKMEFQFRNIQELKDYEIHGVDIGMAVASTLISYQRDSKPDTIQLRTLINDLMISSLAVYYSFRKILKEDNPDLVYIFNGRFSNIRPVLRLCEQQQINYRIHERGSNKFRYNISHNHLPHDLLKFQELLFAAWESEKDIEKKIQIANDFYIKRKLGQEQSWFSFVKDQKYGKLPENWTGDKKNVVIFNSSEDEFAAIGDEFNLKIFKDQLDALEFLSAFSKECKNMHFYLRVHPNLKNVYNHTTNFEHLETKNFFIIPATSDVNTYSLIDNCDLVISFGSTAGIEATYWGKPSILIGRTFYENLESTYNAESKGDVLNWISTSLEPKDKLGAYIYGFYLSTHGISYKIYKPSGLFGGEYKGRALALVDKWSFLDKNRFTRKLRHIYYKRRKI